MIPSSITSSTPPTITSPVVPSATSSNPESITIFGAGAFGTAMAHVLSHASPHRPLTLWARRQETLDVASTKLSQSASQITLTTHLAQSCASDAFIYALPTQAFRSFMQKAPIKNEAPLMVTAKGIEASTGLLFDEILFDLKRSNPLFLWAGPHLAHEILKNAYTSVLIGLPSLSHKKFFHFNTSFLTIHHTTDRKGMMVASVFKNVAALLNGILQAEGMAQNTRYTHLSNLYTDMCSFGEALGAQATTFTHPALLGDFLLTTSSQESRNTRQGQQIGQTEKPISLENKKKGTAQPLSEGLLSIQGLLKRSQKENLVLPTLNALGQRLLKGGTFPKSSLTTQ